VTTSTLLYALQPPSPKKRANCIDLAQRYATAAQEALTAIDAELARRQGQAVNKKASGLGARSQR
jgi:hypothetical protein